MDDAKLMEYFIDQTNQRFDKIDHKLEQLVSFRLILIGVAMAVSAIISVVVQFINK
jgi:hypothetical protein